MKIHRPFIHVVLSLLLLVSQQLGLSHVMAHMDSSRYPTLANAARPAAAKSEMVKGKQAAASLDLLADVNCDQCLAFSQLATALPVVVQSPPPVLPAGFITILPEDRSVCSRSRCVYLSRAPPVIA